MRELQLDGIHDDGDHVVLTDSDGEQYSLRIDEALRAAVRRDRPALGLIQAAERAPLRPRDIQAMLRAGRDAEEIARIADVEVDHVRRFEGPVLAEREYVAERARGFHVGRGGGPALGELAQQRLRARQATGEHRWDAWRNDDGTWTIELAFEAGGRLREAQWVVDVTRQSVAAADDEARWLTDDELDEDEDPRSRVRLAAVKGRVYDVEADGGVDHGAQTTPWATRPTAREEHPAAIGEDDLDALNARRGLRSVPPRPAAIRADSDRGDEPTVWSPLSAATHDEPTREQTTRDASPEAAPDSAQVEQVAQPVGGGEDERPAVESHHGDTVDLAPLASPAGRSAADEAPQESHERPTEPAPRARKARSKRSSIPSWDEIVFGSKNDG